MILWAVWALIPPLSPDLPAKTGSQMSTWRFDIGALSGSHQVWTLDLSSPAISALVLGRILVCSDRDFRPPTTSRKQKDLTSLNQQMEAL